MDDPEQERSTLVIIRAWQEHRPDGPFRATPLVSESDARPAREVVSSIEALWHAIMRSLGPLERAAMNPERPTRDPGE
jgi:hypothetical protein